MRISNKSGKSVYNRGFLVDRRALHAMAEKEGGDMYLAYQKWVSGRPADKTLVLCKSTPQGAGFDEICDDFPIVIQCRLEDDDLTLVQQLSIALERKMRATGVVNKLRLKYPRFTFYMGSR